MKRFAIYREYYDLITLLPNEKDKSSLLLAIVEYMFDDIIPNSLSINAFKVFNNLKRPLDKSKVKSKNSTKNKQNNIKYKSNSNRNENESKTHQDVNVNDNVNVDVNNIFTYLEKIFGRTLNPIEYEEINKWEDSELTRYAIKLSVLNNVYSIKYISTILYNWKKKNIKTIEEAKKDEERFKTKSGIVPKWLDEEQEISPISDKEKKELEELLKGYK